VHDAGIAVVGAYAMPRFKPVDQGLQFLAVDLSQQLHPGSFEYALQHLIDQEIDLSEIEARYANEVQGAWAYDPRMLLKVVLLAYSRGIISSRNMEAACCRDVVFMAISGNSAPHLSTLANFVSSLGPAIGKIFAQVLAVCDRRGLIGRQMFAIDGVKLPSNASKAKSGKRKDFLRQLAKMQKAAEQMLAKQRANDAASADAQGAQREARARSSGCEARWASCASGSRPTRTSARAPKANSACPTAPTTSRPRWPPAKASSRATPGWPRSMRNTRSSSKPKPTARVQSNNCLPR
jgi:transposase